MWRLARLYGNQAFDRLAPQNGVPVRVVLVNPFLDRNVGSVARAMLNFGLNNLVLVDPKCDHLSQDAVTLAAGAESLLREAVVCSQVHVFCVATNPCSDIVQPPQ